MEWMERGFWNSAFDEVNRSDLWLSVTFVELWKYGDEKTLVFNILKVIKPDDLIPEQ